MAVNFVPQNIFKLPNQGLMVSGKISGDEVKAGMHIIIGNETGQITRVELHPNNPVAGLLISGIDLETLQGKIGQSLEITP
jgi:hypothetical protein